MQNQIIFMTLLWEDSLKNVVVLGEKRGSIHADPSMFLLRAASLSPKGLPPLPKGPENPILALKDHFFLQLLHLL